MRWRRIAVYSGLLAAAALIASALSASLKRAEPRPVAREPTFPARVATEVEQRDILRVVLGDRYRGSSSPHPQSLDRLHDAASLRPIRLINRSIRFCAPVVKAESLEPDCALDGIDTAIASPKLAIDRSDAPSLAQPFLAALIDANRQTYPQPIPGGRPTTAMSTDELPRTFQMDFWRKFHDRHPGTAGYVQATRAVVSHDAGHALVYVEHHCGGLCGSGDLHLLRLDAGQWRIETSYRLWIS